LKRRQISEAILLCKMVTKYIGTETCLSSRAKEVPGGHTELTHHFTRGKREGFNPPSLHTTAVITSKFYKMVKIRIERIFTPFKTWKAKKLEKTVTFFYFFYLS